MTTATEILVAQVYERLEFPKPTDYRLELVYVDYRDGFTPEQVEDLLRGEYIDSTDEWINEQQWVAASELADELFKSACDDDELYDDLEDEWRSSSERDDLILSIQEHDTSNPYRDLIRNSGTMLFRVQPDEMTWLDPETLDADGPGRAIAELGLDPDFAPAVAEILPEIAGYAWEGGAHFLPAIVFSANPADLWEHSGYPDADVTISDPFLWLTNPYQGNGMGTTATGCKVTVKLADIHVDSKAWGYSAEDVFGGLRLDDSDITITTKEGA